MTETNIQPAFEAELVKGTFHRTVTRINEEVKKVPDGKGGQRDMIARKLVHEREEYTDAYDIYFPQGHSIRVAADDTEQLRRIGVFGPAPLIDMNSGEEVPQGYNLSPKAIVQSKTRNAGRRHTGGLDDVMEA